MKNRDRQRENRRIKLREEMLDRYNTYGYKDLTPYNAVQKMKTNGKSENVLK